MTQDDVLRYLYLVDRRLAIILRSGIGWKPKYVKELESIDKEISELRILIDEEHRKRQMNAS